MTEVDDGAQHLQHWSDAAASENVVGITRLAGEPLFDPWASVAVPDFPLATLPPIVADFVRAEARLIGCDAAGLAMATIAAMGGAIHHGFRFRLMRNGNWAASPRLWVLLAGDPSMKKTPAINAALRELEEAQGETYDTWKRACADHKAAGGEDEDQPPLPPRYVISDTTCEKLGEILERQSRGVLAKRDELSGWIGGMERYSGRGGGAADRAFWLQAYDGGRYTIDRINRGERHVSNLSVSLVGGIQPAKLAEMRDQTTDGLLQRFVPVMLKPASFPVDEPPGDAEARYGRLIRRLLELEPAGLAMDAAAMTEMDRLRKHIFDIEQASGGLAPGFQAFAGKLPGMAGSIALILHLAADTVHGRFSQIGVETIKAVARIVEDFILPHAFEFYRNTETTTDGDRIKKLASYVLTSKKKRIVVSDLTSNVASMRALGMADIIARVSPLVAAGWLEPEIGRDLAPKAWTVHQSVERQFVERRRIEDQRKDALAKLMRGPRKPGARQ